MASRVLLLVLFVCGLAFAELAAGYGYSQTQRRSSRGEQCRIQRLSSSRPSRRIESEGGVTELWDENEDQFQCAGVAVMRNIIQPHSLSLPNFSPSPRQVYIQRGQAVLGFSTPGCPETFHSDGEQSESERQIIRRDREESEGGEQRRGEEQSSRGDHHQRIHRLRQGDIVALPAGVTHWCYNDGNEELVAFSVADVNSNSNQLDQTPMSFYLAGGQPRRSSSSESSSEREAGDANADNILRAFDADLISDAFDIPRDLAKKIQREDGRGLIVRVRGGMSMIRPDEDEEREERHGEGKRHGESGERNGLDEAFCNMRVNMNLDSPREADVYSRQAGRLNSVNVHKLPILRFLDMSAEKGSLRPNAIFAPQWAINSHNIVYFTRGEGKFQVVNDQGRAVFNDKVRQGDVIVVPQYFASAKRAGNNGLEWVVIKTSALPMRSPLAGQSSVFSAMPVEVLANSYRISTSQAQELKRNREHETLLFHPTARPTSSSSSSA